MNEEILQQLAEQREAVGGPVRDAMAEILRRLENVEQEIKELRKACIIASAYYESVTWPTKK